MAIPVKVENEVIIGKSSRSEECGLEMNASVVKAVTSTLYNYKKEAVVREYSTNITDSHNASGKTGAKGYVHVPTRINPVIEFRDYGLGMSEDDIYNIYTVLGKSTKRGDNTTNGSLGFGSKSYGTVCDQMVVTSVKDGVKTVVVCYKNRKGMLAADTKSISNTNEGNGTLVSIPVKIGEVRQWQEVAAKVLGAFKVPYNNNGFGDYLIDVKSFKNESEKRSKLEDKVEYEFSKIKTKLPLWEFVRNWVDEDKINHYLKLEKLIK